MEQGKLLEYSNTMWLIQVPLAIIVTGVFAFSVLWMGRDEGGWLVRWRYYLVGGFALFALFGAGFHRGMVIDPAALEARRSIGWFFVSLDRSWPLGQFDSVVVENRSYEKVRHDTVNGRAQRRVEQRDYNVVLLVGDQATVEVVQGGSAESAHEQAREIAAATGLRYEPETRSSRPAASEP